MGAVAQPTVLISGAGIAGPSLAHWLTRNGYRVIVVEIADGIRPGGQTVDLRGAGGEVVERMGLMPQMRERALVQHGVAWVGADGSRRAEMPVTAFDGNGLVSKLEILRGDLVDVLYQATKETVEYRFNTRITELEQDDDGVDVTLTDNTKLRADLVVGADGPHSAVRGMVFGPEDQFVTPLGGYNAWFSAPDHVGLDGWYLDVQAPGGLNASMRPTHDPAKAKAGLAFASEPIDYDRHDIDQQRATSHRPIRRRGVAMRRAVDGGRRRPTTSTSTRSSKCACPHGRRGALRSSATPATAPLRSAAWAPAWPWSAPTYWRVNSDPRNPLSLNISKCTGTLPDQDASLRRQMPEHPQPGGRLHAQLGLRHRHEHRGDEVDAALAVPPDRGPAVVHGRRLDRAARLS